MAIGTIPVNAFQSFTFGVCPFFFDLQNINNLWTCHDNFTYDFTFKKELPFNRNIIFRKIQKWYLSFGIRFI